MIDLKIVAGLTGLAFCTRVFYLQHPQAVVFDELHYCRFVSMYNNGTFFFDGQPPLGKLMFAFISYLISENTEVQLDRIGTEYPGSFPILHLRLLSAIFGTLTITIVFYLMKHLKFSTYTAVATSLLFTFDSVLLVQSRFVLLEPLYLFCMSTTLLLILKLTNIKYSEWFSIRWWLVIMSLGIFTGFTISIMYIGFSTLALLLCYLISDDWRLLADKSISNVHLVYLSLSQFFAMAVLPMILYISTFYIHITLLYKAGPHDDMMTSAFQSTLQGGLSSITEGQPMTVVYGSQITLRHTHGSLCWLHSHDEVYPIRYKDQRGSSHQQQVTCYNYKDVNNWWIVKHPNSSSLMVTDPLKPIRQGDIIQLIHGITSRALNSHDVASAMSPQHQEVSCYIDYNISIPAQNLWKVHIVNSGDGDIWHTINSQVSLIHVETAQVLKTSGKQLPEWGFHQLEVVTDSIVHQSAALWNVEEHRYTKDVTADDIESQLDEAEMIPDESSTMSFWEKFFELQSKMLFSTRSSPQDHQFSSAPWEWLFMERNTAYWASTKDCSQIHLVGNLVIWYSAVLAVVLYCVILVAYILRRRRLYEDVSEARWQQILTVGKLFLGGYILHYIPYILMDRVLFLHHYIPALFYKLMLCGAVLEMLYVAISISSLRWVYLSLIPVWLTAVVACFWTFRHVLYGLHSIEREDLEDLKWQPTWDFITTYCK